MSQYVAKIDAKIVLIDGRKLTTFFCRAAPPPDARVAGSGSESTQLARE